MGLFDNGNVTTANTQTTAPAAFQQPYVNGVLSSAGNLQQTQGQTAYPFTGSNLYAPTDPLQQQASQTYGQVGQGVAGASAPTIQAGQGALSGLPQAGQTATNYATGNFNQGQTGAGTVASGNAANAVAATNAGLNGALTGIQNNTVGNVVGGAGQVINNGVLQGQIDAIGTDINRNLNQVQLPGLNAHASANGNMDSSRAGVAEGIYRSQAQENLANASANLRGNAYNAGLNLAAGINSTNITGSNAVANNANWATGEAVQGQSANNSAIQAANADTLQGANTLGTQAQIGNSLLSTGANLGTQGAAAMATGGAINQANQQGIDNANVTAFNNQQQYPWTVLNDASNVIQKNNWGTNQASTNTVTTNPAPLSNAISGVGLVGGLLSSGSANSAPGILSGLLSSTPGTNGAASAPALLSSAGISNAYNGSLLQSAVNGITSLF